LTFQEMLPSNIESQLHFPTSTATGALNRV
jgi:hypothetical protein